MSSITIVENGRTVFVESPYSASTSVRSSFPTDGLSLKVTKKNVRTVVKVGDRFVWRYVPKNEVTITKLDENITKTCINHMLSVGNGQFK